MKTVRLTLRSLHLDRSFQLMLGVLAICSNGPFFFNWQNQDILTIIG